MTPSEGELAIPSSLGDLFRRPVCGVLTTLMPDGQPRSSLVWVDAADGSARFNTTLERAKGRELRLDPRLSLLVVDPDDTARFIQVRGEAELTTIDAERHLDRLTLRYTGHPRFYGYIYPESRRVTETRVIGTIHARRITLDAIHR
jgi:PPOX class probable F420-dependent enzyme